MRLKFALVLWGTPLSKWAAAANTSAALATGAVAVAVRYLSWWAAAMVAAFGAGSPRASQRCAASSCAAQHSTRMKMCAMLVSSVCVVHGVGRHGMSNACLECTIAETSWDVGLAMRD